MMIREVTGRWGRSCEDESMLLCQSSRGFNAWEPSSFRMSSGGVIASRRLHGRVKACGYMPALFLTCANFQA